ncbi:hypothetical protein V8E54_012987 [Elaphomyces granulatus]
MASKSEYITLVSKDNASFTVERDIAECSIRLYNMLNDNDVDPDKPISIPEVDGFALKRVLEWCTHRQRDPWDSDEWNQKFIDNQSDNTLWQLCLAAAFLDIKGLSYLASDALLGKMIKRKSLDEIRKIFGSAPEKLVALGIPMSHFDLACKTVIGKMIEGELSARQICKAFDIKFTREEFEDQIRARE